MEQSTHTGIADGIDAGTVEPIKITVPEPDEVLNTLSDENYKKLCDFLSGRLGAGAKERDTKLQRYAQIDRIISTWQKLDSTNSERERIEDLTGRNQALPMNLPLLATHLDDLVAYFSEVFAPTGNNFFTTSGNENTAKLVEKMNRDSAARTYYAQMTLTIRSILKYNIGGFHVEWERAGTPGSGIASAGNRWTAIDPYNTIYDPSIMDVNRLATEGEWAATIEVKNRLWLMRKGLAGEFNKVNAVLDDSDRNNLSSFTGKRKAKLYRPPPVQAGLPADGSDERTTKKNGEFQAVDWDKYGASLTSETGFDIEGYEVVTMYCWLNPNAFGLLNQQEKQQIKALGADEKSFLELWKFIIVDGYHVVQATPAVPREEALQQSEASGTSVLNGGEIPIYLSHLTLDQMKQAQRSIMELMRGFQRFGSYLLNIYIAGMRKNVWGLKAIDPTMFDASKLKQGEVAGILESKIAGRDVRSGLQNIDQASGVENSITSLDQTMGLMRQLFPSQGLPSQVASIDRAVKSQVSSVMQGAQRKLHMLARLLDSMLLMPARVGAYRNLLRWDNEGIRDLKDEEVAKVLGSGIESIASERIAESLKELIFALLQNPESAARFDLTQMFTYLSRVMNLGTNLGDFVVEQEQQPQGQQQGQGEGSTAPNAGESFPGE